MRILLLLSLVVVLFVLYIWYLESTAIFLPSREITTTPQSLGVPYENITFKTQDGVILNGWLAKPAQHSKRSTLIYFHGNAGNISDRAEKVAAFVKLGLNVFIIDYRGYGKSQGKPTEKGLYSDAIAAYDYVIKRPDIDKERIVVYGVSLGGAPAIDLATKRKIAALIIESSFSNAHDMARIIVPFAPAFLIRTQMASDTKVQSLMIPKLFVHSREDETIPFVLGKKLFDAAPHPKEFLEISGTHNEGYLLNSSLYWSGINRFLEKNKLL